MDEEIKAEILENKVSEEKPKEENKKIKEEVKRNKARTC